MLEMFIFQASVHNNNAKSDTCMNILWCATAVWYNPIGVIYELLIYFFTEFGLHFTYPFFENNSGM